MALGLKKLEGCGYQAKKEVYLMISLAVWIIVKSRSFKVCLDYAKRSLNRVANAIFGKIGRLASEEVILQLIVSKCMPMLLFGLEACTLNKSQLSSLDFTINRFFNETVSDQ